MARTRNGAAGACFVAVGIPCVTDTAAVTVRSLIPFGADARAGSGGTAEPRGMASARGGCVQALVNAGGVSRPSVEAFVTQESAVAAAALLAECADETGDAARAGASRGDSS